jgi:hypothetical protein
VLSIVWPRFARELTVAHSPDLAGGRRLASTARIPWRLPQATSAGERFLVHVRFGTGTWTVWDGIVLDTSAPAVLSIRPSPAPRARNTVRRATRSAAPTGRARPVVCAAQVLALRVREIGSGIDALQVRVPDAPASAKGVPPTGWIPWSWRAAIQVPGGLRVVARVRDRAGNASPWRRAERGPTCLPAPR